MRAFLGEMAAVFEDDYLFLGGDELATTCFDDSPNISAWMKDRGLNASSTQQYFWQQMTASVFPHLNKTISVWRANDPGRGALASNLPPGSVFNVCVPRGESQGDIPHPNGFTSRLDRHDRHDRTHAPWGLGAAKQTMSAWRAFTWD